LAKPQPKRDVIDYSRFNGETIAGFIHELAAALKQRTGGNKVVGCFFGYLSTAALTGSTRTGTDERRALREAPRPDQGG